MQRIFLAAGVALMSLALIVGCSSKPSEEELFVKAKKAQEARDFYAAVQAYQNVVTEYPQGDRADEAQFMIGFLYANDIQDTAKAKDAYQKFLDNYTAVSDSGMVLSAKWELANLGKDIKDIEEVVKFAEETEPESKSDSEKGEVKEMK